MNQKLYPQADKVGPLETGGRVVVVISGSRVRLDVLLSQLFNGPLGSHALPFAKWWGFLAPLPPPLASKKVYLSLFRVVRIKSRQTVNPIC